MRGHYLNFFFYIIQYRKYYDRRRKKGRKEIKKKKKKKKKKKIEGKIINKSKKANYIFFLHKKDKQTHRLFALKKNVK